MNEKKLSSSFEVNKRMLDELFKIGVNFDVAGREMRFAGSDVKLYFVDSFMNTAVLERLLIFFTELRSSGMPAQIDAGRFAAEFVPFGETSVTDDVDTITYSVLSGTVCLISESFGANAIIMDLRIYPARAIKEPDNDKVLRGARDGFVEAIKHNICMMRRRIRDTNFIAEKITVGENSRTDVALCYISGVADEGYVKKLRDRLKSLKVGSLPLGHQSLAEALVPSKWYNPFPKFRYTERPDAAAASVLEGSVVILCDTSPEAMILPTGIFDFLQEASDYYLPPLTGSYLRVLRHFVFILTLILTPLWYLLIENPEIIPGWLDFIKVKHEYTIPIIAQLFAIELALDGLKLASLNTPDALSNSLSVVGGLILGDFAVQVGWFIPEVIVYMAIVAISNFTQPSFELGFAFKFMRMMLLGLTALLNVWGFVLGILLIIFFIVSNNTVDGSRSYLYPLIPFNAKALKRLLLRVSGKSVDFNKFESRQK